MGRLHWYAHTNSQQPRREPTRKQGNHRLSGSRIGILEPTADLALCSGRILGYMVAFEAVVCSSSYTSGNLAT